MDGEPEGYGLARIQSLEADDGVAWLELVNGGLALQDIDDLPVAEVGSLVYIGLQSGDVLPAPAAARWPRQIRMVGVLKSFNEERGLMEVAGSFRAVDGDSVTAPKLDGHYYFDERDQRWAPLTDEESKILESGADSDEISPFNIEDMAGAEKAASAFGGMGSDFERLQKAVEGNFAMRASGAAPKSKPPAGAIFFGPPGTGKTHLARALAQKLGAVLISVNGPELLDKYLGSTEKAFRALFREARAKERSIVFIDEFDTIGSQRGPDVHEAINRQVGQLLALMDPAVGGPRPFVIAATNRLEDVDSAFLRPGRFDIVVEFRAPATDDRLSVLKVQTRDLAIAGDEVVPWIAEATDGWTPAELQLIWTEAELRRTNEGRTELALEDIIAGFSRAREQHATVERAKDRFAKMNEG